MVRTFNDWLRTLGAPEDAVATDTSSPWSAMSLLKAIYANSVGLVNGTAGDEGELAAWDADGNAVGSGYTPIDEDTMTSDSAAHLPTQQSVKAYVDAAVAAILNGVSSSFDTLAELATGLATKLTIASNLSDLADAATARDNLGVEIGADVQAFDADTAKTDVAQEWTARQNFNAGTLTSTSNAVAWNLNTHQCATHVLTENTTITPSNLVDGGTYMLKIVQGDSAFTVAWDAIVLWPGGVAPTISTAGDDIDVLSFYSDGTNLFGAYQQAFA